MVDVAVERESETRGSWASISIKGKKKSIKKKNIYTEIHIKQIQTDRHTNA